MKKLDVYFTLNEKEKRFVGRLAESEHRIYFEYDDSFLQNPLWLSPFKLPPEPGLHEHRDLSFGPIFGLFDDSLPDGWGLLLMDRYFRKQGVISGDISPLDRLAYLGNHTMGALTYHPPIQQEKNESQLLDLHNMAIESYEVLAGKSEDVLPQLMLAGGSPGGARPKVLVGICDDNIISGGNILPDGYNDWLVKFYSKQGAIDDGRVEYVYSQMARSAGILMPDTRLFTASLGEAFFGIMRFDRQHNQRRHMHTFGNLIHSSFRVPSCDYELLLKVTGILTKNRVDTIRAFRLMVFNILAHNRDDHVKNFAFIIDAHGSWRFSPAYDLTFTYGPGGEHTMTVDGEGREPNRKHIMNIAKGAGVKQSEAINIINEVATAIEQWRHLANSAEIMPNTIAEIEKATQSCLRRVLG
ncbi:MAG: type II toxin-antitoxin system HipA family toxin [Kiritimatiellae bacterium]|nr:type II toxin-antitoxin system HipA family toxin [Kiritimatiellia bacterium]